MVRVLYWPKVDPGEDGLKFQTWGNRNGLPLGECDFQPGVLGEDDFMSPCDPGVEDDLTDLVIGEAGDQPSVRCDRSHYPCQQVETVAG